MEEGKKESIKIQMAANKRVRDASWGRMYADLPLKYYHLSIALNLFKVSQV